MAITDTGWKKPELVQTSDGSKAVVQMASGMEQKPCFTCRSWEKDTKKLIQFLTSHGLQPDADGNYETPIVKDFKGRRSLQVNPRDYGFCRQGCCPTHMNASCENWQPTRFASELALKVR